MLILLETMPLRSGRRGVYGDGNYGDGEGMGTGGGKGFGDGLDYGDPVTGDGHSILRGVCDELQFTCEHTYHTGPPAWWMEIESAPGFVEIVIYVAARSRRC